MPWFLTPHGPHFVVEPGTIDEYERRDYVQMTDQQVTDYYAGVATPDPPSFATEAEVPGIVASAVQAGTGALPAALRAASVAAVRDNGGFELFGASPRARGAVCFTYDDAYVSKRQVADLATARGQRNTFFITSDQVGTANRIAATDLVKWKGQGHEIGAHSKDHSNITSLGTATARVAQYDTPLTVLDGILGVGSVRSWAYPFGARNATSDQELYGRYRSAFGTGTDISAVIPIADRDGRFLYGRQAWSQGNHSTILDLIRLAAASPVVVVIYTHDPGNTSGSFPTDPTIAQVTEAYDLAKSLGVPCLGVSEALPTGNVIRNGGFEDGLTGWSEPLARPSGLVVESIADTPDVGLPGTRSLHIGAAAPTGGNYKVEQTIAVRPGTSWTFSSRWRSANMTAGQFQFDFVRLDAGGAQIGATTSVITTNLPWTKATRTVVCEANTAAVKLSFLANGTVVGDFYLDHVDLRPTQFGAFG